MPPARTSRPTWFTLVVGVLMLGFCALVGTMLLQLRAQAWAQARISADNLLATLSQDIDRNVEVYDLSLQAVVTGMRLPELPGLRPAVRQALLFDGAASARYLGAIFVLDERGDVVEDSAAVPPRHGNLGDREYFRVQRDHPDAGLYVSAPLQSRISAPGEMVIALSRRLSRPDGSFAGVVVGTMRLDYFRNLFGHLDLGPNASLSLLRADGIMLMRAPSEAGQIGRDLSGTGNVRRFMAKRSGSFNGTAAVDGVRRLYTFTHVGALPLILDVALSEADILAAWRGRAAVIGAALLVLGAMTMGLALLFAREMRCSARARLALEAAHAEVTRLAGTDGLTGLANRRRFDEALEREWRRAGRGGVPLGLLMLDVDCFKAFNDRYGHQEGDACLRAVARAVAGCVGRPTDLVARYGGEELVLLLPDLGEEGAARVGERVRAAVEALRIPHEGNPAHGGVVTVSLGAAGALPGPLAAQAQALVSAADQALYESKRRGRNRVTAHLGPEGQKEPAFSEGKEARVLSPDLHRT